MRRLSAFNHHAAIAALAAVVLQMSLPLAATASSPVTAGDAYPEAGELLVWETRTLVTVDNEVDRFLALAAAARDRRAAEAAARAKADAEAAAFEAARTSDVFATVDGLELHLPSAQPLAIGFHEAREEHLTMVPRNVQAAGQVIMPTRDREGTPTSAVDIVMPANQDVLSPVAGRIISVAPYTLYDEYEDIQIQIQPDGHPDLVITIYHLSGVRVQAGQRLEAGHTVLADSARVFDFIAQVEAWARGPHIDLRVHRV